MAETPEPEDVELEPIPAAEQNSFSERMTSRLEGRGPLLVAVVATMASLALLCLFAYLLLRPDGAEEEPTPTSETDAEQIELDTDTFEYQAISDTGAITLTMETPVFLDVAGEEFTVQPEVLPESGPWTPPTANETTIEGNRPLGILVIVLAFRRERSVETVGRNNGRLGLWRGH